MKRLNISVLLLAFLLMFVIKSSVQQREYLYRGSDDRHANFLQHPRVFLDVSPMAIKKVHDALYCIWQCLENTRCLSVNLAVKPDVNNKYECQLLATDKYISPDNLKSSKEFNHHSLRTPCDAHENVCQNGGTCRPIPYEMQEYKCECAAGYFGTNCQQIEIDECLTGVHGCDKHAVCTNTVGSYTCTCKNPFTGDGKTCIGPSECQSYRILDSADRRTTYNAYAGHCDSGRSGWHRIQGSAGTRMPTSCVPTHRCASRHPGWLNGEHPTVAEGKVSRQVCFRKDGNCCYWFTNIQVRNCGAFYVYNIDRTPDKECPLRYCGTD